MSVASSSDVTKTQRDPLPERFAIAVEEIKRNLAVRGQTLKDAIAARHLYFRVSLLGVCNLSCPFCHNEGAPNRGRIDKQLALAAIAEAYAAGFRRVQFTGGEPLLHPEVHEFVAAAKQIMPDVGVTTNGTRLPTKLTQLSSAGLDRIHVSLQEEALRSGSNGPWSVPDWLGAVLALAKSGELNVRLNLPVRISELANAGEFLVSLAEFQCDVQLFAILPTGDALTADERPIADLAESENTRRRRAGTRGSVFTRGYKAPRGYRCSSCSSRDKCKEQSHSLRLGADHVLRPCLASRSWDIKTSVASLDRDVEIATLLALDYEW